jgi:hypothetical protein
MGKCFLPIKLTDKKKDSGLKNSIEIKVPQAKFRRISNPAELCLRNFQILRNSRSLRLVGFFVAKFWLVGIFWVIKIFEGKWLNPFFVNVYFIIGEVLKPPL